VADSFEYPFEIKRDSPRKDVYRQMPEAFGDHWSRGTEHNAGNPGGQVIQNLLGTAVYNTCGGKDQGAFE